MTIRSQSLYRVEIREWRGGRRYVRYANLTGKRLPCGFPCWVAADTKSPQGLMSGKDARAIVKAMRQKPWRLDAHAVREETQPGQLPLRQPTGEAA